MNSSDTCEPRLSPDFAQRVLAQADSVVTRRRRVVAGTAAIVCVVVVVGAGAGAGLWAARPGTAARPAPSIAQTAEVSSSADDQTDALAYLFPDAAPVARFAAEYSDTTEDDDSDVLASLDDSGTS